MPTYMPTLAITSPQPAHGCKTTYPKPPCALSHNSHQHQASICPVQHIPHPLGQALGLEVFPSTAQLARLRIKRGPGHALEPILNEPRRRRQKNIRQERRAREGAEDEAQENEGSVDSECEHEGAIQRRLVARSELLCCFLGSISSSVSIQLVEVCCEFWEFPRAGKSLLGPWWGWTSCKRTLKAGQLVGKVVKSRLQTDVATQKRRRPKPRDDGRNNAGDVPLGGWIAGARGLCLGCLSRRDQQPTTATLTTEQHRRHRPIHKTNCLPPSTLSNHPYRPTSSAHVYTPPRPFAHVFASLTVLWAPVAPTRSAFVAPTQAYTTTTIPARQSTSSWLDLAHHLCTYQGRIPGATATQTLPSLPPLQSNSPWRHPHHT